MPSPGACEVRTSAGTYRRHRLSPEAFEFFFQWDEIERRMTQLASGGVRRIVLADLGKNVYPFHRAALHLGMEIVAIGDDRFAERGRCYRGAPIVVMEEALTRAHDAVVVANASQVHGGATHRRVSSLADGPVYFWLMSDGEQPTTAHPASDPIKDSVTTGACAVGV